LQARSHQIVPAIVIPAQAGIHENLSLEIVIPV
jgi:hypothetical protein